MEDLNKPKVSVSAIIISAVLAVVVFGGGVYAYQSNQAKKDKDALKSQITALETEKANLEKQVADSVATTTTTATTAPVTATDETANWKTYENKTIGFSFKYPTTWKATDDNQSDISVANTAKAYVLEGSDINPIIVQYVKDTSGASINNYLTGGRASLKSILKDSTTVGGKTAYVLQGTTAPVYHESRLFFTMVM